jgi:hypothetical protein
MIFFIILRKRFRILCNQKKLTVFKRKKWPVEGKTDGSVFHDKEMK